MKNCKLNRAIGFALYGSIAGAVMIPATGFAQNPAAEDASRLEAVVVTGSRIKRTEIGPSAEEVLGHFAERMVGLDDKQAVEEAKRCMSCGMCFECDNCVIYCPQTAVKRTPKAEATMGRYVYTDYDLCIGCHICADVCPTGYIKMGLGEH